MKKNGFTFVSCKEPYSAFDITEIVEECLDESDNGFILVYTPHTSTNLSIAKCSNELLKDYSKATRDRLVLGRPFRHSSGEHKSGEQHAVCFLSGFEVLVPVKDGKLMMGDEQRILMFESTGEERERSIWVYNLKGEVL